MYPPEMRVGRRVCEKWDIRAGDKTHDIATPDYLVGPCQQDCGPWCETRGGFGTARS